MKFSKKLLDFFKESGRSGIDYQQLCNFFFLKFVSEKILDSPQVMMLLKLYHIRHYHHHLHHHHHLRLLYSLESKAAHQFYGISSILDAKFISKLKFTIYPEIEKDVYANTPNENLHFVSEIWKTNWTNMLRTFTISSDRNAFLKLKRKYLVRKFSLEILLEIFDRISQYSSIARLPSWCFAAV